MSEPHNTSLFKIQRVLTLTLHGVPTAVLVLVAVVSPTRDCMAVEKPTRMLPEFTVTVPKPFRTSVTVRRYHKGEDILRSPPFELIASAAMTEYYGWYGPRTGDPLHGHAWRIRVYATLNPNVVASYAEARDGFEADLNEAKEFLGWSRVATFDTFARFTRKHFRWGNAVSFLHAEYQDGPDIGAYVPDNGHLDYEVWGITSDRQYTVVASVLVSHPKLAQWPNARTVKSIEALKRDRDYKLIEKCSPQEFEPSLTGFDQLVDSLKIRSPDHSN